MSTHAIDTLKSALEVARDQAKAITADTFDAIRAGDAARALRDEADRRVRELEQSIAILERDQIPRQEPMEVSE